MIATALVLSLAGVAYLSGHRTEVSPVEMETVPAAEQGAGDTPGQAAEATDSDPSTRSKNEQAIADEKSKPEDSTTEVTANDRRWVVFKPTPPNVSISVNGSRLKPYGPDFQRVRVKVGNHTFRFVGAEGCCEERVVRKRIRSGASDFELSVKLRYRPARLYLKGPAPADATVRITLPGNRTVTGRIREILPIPMSSLQSSVQVQIRAPGYRTYNTVVKLRAGSDLTEHSFKLERDGETP